MEYLRDIFHTDISVEIKKNGDILIEGYPLSRELILKDMEPIGYEDAFNGWLQRYTDELTDKAQSILDLHDNRARFNTLKGKYKRGAIIPFVGAGMSISSGFRGWTSFLWQLRNETRVTEEDLNRLLNAGEYEKAAQLMANDMPAGSFDETLENTYVHDEEVVGPVQILPLMFPPCVITTNFDNILKKVYEAASKPFDETLLGADSDDLTRYLGGKESVLIKLHGKANSGKHRILTYDEYEAYYSEEVTLPNRIEDICKNTLLFLGCSLTFDRTIEAMRSIVETKGHEGATRHYAFLPLNENDDRLTRRDDLALANIFPIWYPADEGHDECLEALLYELAKGVVEI